MAISLTLNKQHVHTNVNQNAVLTHKSAIRIYPVLLILLRTGEN
jgi:hypothetical protein